MPAWSDISLSSPSSPPPPALRYRSRSARRVNLTGTVVAVNQQSDSVTLIDLKTMEAYRHVPVVGGPHEAAASPDGRSVVVTNYNKQGVGQQKTLSVLALPSGDTIKTIDLGEYRAPHDVRWVDPTHVVVTSEANQALLLVNITSGADRARVPHRGRRVAHAGALHRSHAPLLLEHARRQRERVRLQDRREDQGREDRQGMRGRGRDARRPLGVGRQPRRRHDLDHRHAHARGHQADFVAGLPLPRAVHARRQARARAARAGVVARRGRRRQPDRS